MYKLSRYLVVTEPINNIFDKRILFATRTAKTFTISSSLLNKMQAEEWDSIANETMERFKRAEVIISKEEDELNTVISRNKNVIQNKKSFYYVIQPSAMCQLGCGYCGQHHTKDSLEEDASIKTLARIEEKLKERSYKSVHIGWFGAEPLLGLKQIRTMSPDLIRLAKEHGCNYSAKMVTNGLSLKEPIFIDLVTKYKVKEFEVTLDGTAEYHDQRRHTKSNLSSFNIILNNLLKIFSRPDYKELGCSISIRCNVDRRNSAGVTPLIKLLAEYNLQDKIDFFYVAPIHSWGNDAHLLSQSKEEFGQLEIDWMIDQFKHGFKPGLLPDLNHVVCMSVDPNAEMVDAFGNLFDCTEVSYVPAYENSEYLLGNIKDNKPLKERPLLHFNDEVLSKSLPCSSCEMLPVCGGACPKSWREGMAPCPSNKFNIKEKLQLYYATTKKEAFKDYLSQN